MMFFGATVLTFLLSLHRSLASPVTLTEADLNSDDALSMELDSLRPMPPAIILRAGGDKIFIPLPCKSKMCSALLFKLASLGKIPWHYAIPSNELLLEEALEEEVEEAAQEMMMMNNRQAADNTAFQSRNRAGGLIATKRRSRRRR